MHDRTRFARAARFVLPFMLGVLVVAGATPASATYPGQSGRIAFVRVDGAGRQQLFTIEPNGQGEHQLTAFTTGDMEGPDWSPDGSTIAFDTDIGGNVHIYTVKADGTGLTQVTSGDGSEFTPSWSPDGTTMAVDAAEPGLAEGISILDVATGTLTPITANPYGIFDAEPQYSPDGAWVTFTRLQSFSPPRSAVFVVRADGSSLQRLTPWRLNAAESDWSPDGSRIAFNSADENIKFAHVYLVNPDGTGLTRITPTSYSAFRPCWSPDGTRIVFTRIRVGIHGSPFDLGTMKPDGSDVTPLTQTPDFENQADWGIHP